MSGVAAAAAPPAPEVLLLLVRHAEQRTLLSGDPELSPRGREQARRLADRLVRLPLTAVVSSPLRRAFDTARAVADRTGLDVEVDPDLEEVRMPDSERSRRFTRGAGRQMEPHPDDYATAALAGVRLVTRMRWTEDGGGESGESLRARGDAAVERLVRRHHRGVVVCVAHGGWINAVLGTWLGAERDLWFVPWHTGISAVLVTGTERILLAVNDASHLSREEDMLHLVAHHVRAAEASS